VLLTHQQFSIKIKIKSIDYDLIIACAKGS